MKTFTVVYSIEDEAEWAKTNPLNYAHHGAKAVGCAVGDQMGYSEELERHVSDEIVQEAQKKHTPT